jgi:hypothetical protein
MERREPASGAGVDSLFAELMAVGEDVPGIRSYLGRHDPEEAVLLALLRRPVPVRFLELVGTTPPWADHRRVLGAVVLNPRAPRQLALRLLPSLFWRDLAEVAASARLPAGVRARAEGTLKEMLPQMRLGERVSLGKLATPPVLALLLGDPEARVLEAALVNPRLREEDLLVALRKDNVPMALLHAVADSWRWRECYAVRLALVLQSRTPLPLALAQISSLLKRDLIRVAQAQGLRPLVQLAAQRLAGSDR